MDNVISLHKEKHRNQSAKKEFHTSLEIPLNLGLSENEEAEPKVKPKKTSAIRRYYLRTKWKINALYRKVVDSIFLPIRQRLYNWQSKRLLSELMLLTVELNRADFHITFNYSGHVDRIDIVAYLGGWKNREDEVYGTKVRILRGALPGKCRYGKMKPRDIRHAINLLKTLSKAKKDAY